MSDKMFNSYGEQVAMMFAPMAKVSQVMLSNMEKLTEFQLESLKSYSKMGLHQLKSAAEIQDAEAMRQFAQRQSELLGNVSKKIVDDTRQLTEMGLQFRQEMERVLGESSQFWQNVEKNPVASSKAAARATA